MGVRKALDLWGLLNQCQLEWGEEEFKRRMQRLLKEYEREDSSRGP